MEANSRDALLDWKAFHAHDIPTKGIKLPPLFEETLTVLAANRPCLQILELGCGTGELATSLAEKGHRVVGIDVNEGAIVQAQTSYQQRIASNYNDSNKIGTATFLVGDVTTFRLEHLSSTHSLPEKVDFCILQLLLSIVGNASKRYQTISSAHHSLKSGGYIYVSCSGVSDTINPNYKKLYEQDYPVTKEMYTYFSRSSKDGCILYETHHFQMMELKLLLENCGFVDVHVQQVKEASSRRPEEAAFFLYAVARKL
jgi:SAM-dependent methyltransferase